MQTTATHRMARATLLQPFAEQLFKERTLSAGTGAVAHVEATEESEPGLSLSTWS